MGWADAVGGKGRLIFLYSLVLHLPFAQALAVRKGWAAPEVEQVFNRARELGQQMADNPQLYPMLGGLTAFYMFRGQLHTAWEIGQQYFALVQHADDPARRLHVHALLGELLDSFGEFAAARAHFEQAMTPIISSGPMTVVPSTTWVWRPALSSPRCYRHWAIQSRPWRAARRPSHGRRQLPTPRVLP